MAVWEELRVILTSLRDEQSGTLLEFPDPSYEEGQPPPFQITLAPSAVAVAEDLHRRFGHSVLLTVGCLPYPPGRPPDRPLDILTRPPSELLDPQEAEARLDGPAAVRSGETLHHGLLVRNLTGRELTIVTNGQVTAVVVNPRTGSVIGGFAEAQHPIWIDFRVAPGTTERIPLLIGTASFTPALGYTVPAGSWGIQVPLDLQGDMHTRDSRWTPVLPLTITA